MKMGYFFKWKKSEEMPVSTYKRTEKIDFGNSECEIYKLVPKKEGVKQPAFVLACPANKVNDSFMILTNKTIDYIKSESTRWKVTKFERARSFYKYSNRAAIEKKEKSDEAFREKFKGTIFG